MTRLKIAILILLGLVICSIMLGLGYWQVSRAEQKQAILDQVQERSLTEPVSLSSILPELSFAGVDPNTTELDAFNFKQVFAQGEYAPTRSIFIDNKVLASRVGYKLLTPLKVSGSNWWILVDRGWLSVGESRENLPVFSTQSGNVSIDGRLVKPPAQPPLWNERYRVVKGAVWQYLPISHYAAQMDLNLLPLVLELAPVQSSEIDQVLLRQWSAIDDQWVAKHKGYAFQWFAMALAFFIACSVLGFRSLKPVN